MRIRSKVIASSIFTPPIQSAQFSQRQDLEVTRKLTRLNSVLATSIKAKKLEGINEKDLNELKLFFDTAAHSYMAKGDTQNSHLFADCTDACAIMAEMHRPQLAENLKELKQTSQLITSKLRAEASSVVRNKV